MLQLKNGGRLVEHVHELPDLSHARELFLDVETTSGKDGEKAFSSWKGDRICGVAVTADDAAGAWYVPVRHRGSIGDLNANIDIEPYTRWLHDTVTTCESWVNHNVKFDAHFCAAENAEFKGRLVDTLTLSKLIDSDRTFKGGYGLDALSAAWLEESITDYEKQLKDHLAGIKLPRNRKAQDYALVPIDVMAAYACQDVLTNRSLYRYLQRRCPEDAQDVWNTEVLLTPVLYDIEREGLRVDPVELAQTELKILTQLVTIEEQLHTEVGFSVNPASSENCFDLLVNCYGLPVLAWNDKGNPSFDKDALASYMAHPDVVSDETRLRVVKLLMHYRKLNTLLTFFVRPYQEHAVNGVMHSDYNQSVRSGRMSCKRPNAQQLSPAAKDLVHPPDGEAFLSCDYSQVEFRLIVHYINDVNAIKAYMTDPDTDFHRWVAEMCQIPRKPAKNVNFAIGYGAGKNKVTKMLAANMELMADLGGQIDVMIAAGDLSMNDRARHFQAMCNTRAEEVYWQYHDTLPGLRITTRQASRKIISRGYVRNAYGRRAHLPELASHIAFNRLIQGCAADIMKERTVALAPRYNSETRATGMRLAASVHDETLLVGDREVTRDPRVVSHVVRVLEDTAFKFRVPIRTGASWSERSWREASSDDAELPVERDPVAGCQLAATGD